MNKLENLWNYWAKINTYFVTIVGLLFLGFLLFKTTFSITENRNILKQLLLTHIEKESSRIADEVHLKLQTLKQREEIINEFLKKYGRVKLSIISKKEKLDFTEGWFNNSGIDSLYKKIYFGNLQIGTILIKVYWNSIANSSWQYIPLIVSFIFLLTAILITIGIHKRIKRKVFIPAFKEIQKQSELEGYREMAKQVAHDIRSPLAALNMVIVHVDNLEESQRLLIKTAVNRINDIANNLIKSRKETCKAKPLLGNKLKLVYVQSILESLIAEKRAQYKNLKDIRLNLIIDPSSYGMFSKVDPIEFSRALSNVINNSFEACEGNGKIDVIQRKLGDKLEIIVSDTGKGIESSLLSKIGKKGATFGKPDGTGLGLFHAFSFIEKWGGDIDIKSEMGKGTTITISLPLRDPPSTFVPNLSYNTDTQIVVLDDDDSIHRIWENRFIKNKIDHYKSPEEFLNNFKEYETEEALFLIDYEYRNSDLNGLDVISKLKNNKNVYLITSYFEDQNIINKCKKFQVGLIPKSCAGFIPLNYLE